MLDYDNNYLLASKAAQQISRQMPHRLPHPRAVPYSFTAPVMAET
jgi:hypothetical protein